MERVRFNILSPQLRRQAESALDRLTELPEECSNQNGFLAEMAAHEAMLALMESQGDGAQFRYVPTDYESDENRFLKIDAYVIPKRDIPQTQRFKPSQPSIAIPAGTPLPIDWALCGRTDEGELTMRPGKEGCPWVVPMRVGWFMEVLDLDPRQRVWILRPENLQSDLLAAFQEVVRAWLAVAVLPRSQASLLRARAVARL